mmetsp:Transcript_11212/g.26593  ORF Transcript_11212/g.26593 Transcript_11212/m.26593 type:complete len:184 (-) Transcript_11212:1566-2117(-)
MNNLLASYDSQLQSLISTIESKLRDGKYSETGLDLSNAESVLRRMELEVRSLGEEPCEAVQKVRYYKNLLLRQRADLNSVLTALNDPCACVSRDGLESCNRASETTFQRERLLSNTDKLRQTSTLIEQGRQTLLQTEELGTGVLRSLQEQRHAITRAQDSLRQTDSSLGQARKTLKSLTRWLW